MEWFDISCEYHRRTFGHEADLLSLPAEWQRELAALWRLEADVNNGAYLQFLANWGRESYVYASQALKKIGAHKMAALIDACQALVDEHFPLEGKTRRELQSLLPNEVIGMDGTTVKERGSPLPDDILARIYDLSYEFMAYPDDIAKLGQRYYRPFVKADAPWLLRGWMTWFTQRTIGARIQLVAGIACLAAALGFSVVVLENPQLAKEWYSRLWLLLFIVAGVLIRRALREG